jgi:hypothetical protein
MALENELKVLERLITVTLNPANLKPDKLNDAFISECRLLANNEKERIKNQFTSVIFNPGSESLIEIYFRHHQTSLIKLSDTIFNYLQQKTSKSIYRLTNKSLVINFYKEILRLPEELLQFIAENYPGYFNNEIKIPDAEKWKLEPEIKSNLKQIRAALRKTDLNEEVLGITCEPIEALLSSTIETTYRELAYLKAVINELQYFINRKNGSNVNEEFSHLLLYLNYNRLRFFNYYIKELKNTGDHFNTMHDQIDFYSLQLKLINQLPVKPGLIYKPGLPSLKEQIGTWICEELYYLEKKQRLNFPAIIQGDKDWDKSGKIHTNLSVSQLALGVKLLVDAKVITNKNSTELMSIVARTFKTDRQDIISEDSLRNKSYNFETSTVEKLKDKIIGLLNMVRAIKCILFFQQISQAFYFQELDQFLQ